MKKQDVQNLLLALIALNLSVLSAVLTGLVPNALADEGTTNASTGVQMVRLVPNETLDVNIKELGGSSFYGQLPVEVKNRDEIQVDIKEVGGYSVYGGKLKVEVVD